jgi:hypothetical protein
MGASPLRGRASFLPNAKEVEIGVGDVEEVNMGV